MVPEETEFRLQLFDSIPGGPGQFSIEREDGSVGHIPLHRVRTVYNNGEVIGRRSGRAPAADAV